MQIAGGIAGVVVGSAFGMPGLGYTLGSTLFGMLDKPDQKSSPSATMDLRVPGTQDGRPLPWIRGAARVAPDWAWHTDRRAITIPGSGGGGGGKGGTPEPATSDQTTYEMDALFILNINGGVGLAEIYRSGELIWRMDSGASAGTIAASNLSEHWDRLTVYTGDASQLPDPDYDAWVDANVGVGQAPAYRGRMSVFVKNLKLGSSGQIPQLEFTVVVDGSSGPELTYYEGTASSASVIPQLTACCAVDATRGKVWFTDIDYASGDSQDRIAVLDLATGTFSYIGLESPWESFGGITFIEEGIHMFMVPEWDRVYIQATGPGRIPLTTLVYSISSQEYLTSFHDHFGVESPVFNSNVLALDVANAKALMHISGVGYSQIRIVTLGDGLPVSQFEGIDHVGIDGLATAHADSEGNFWLPNSAIASWEKIGPGGNLLDTVPYGADDCDESATCYDPTRNAIFFWSEGVVGGEYLKTLDCATGTISRVGSTQYAVGGVSPARQIIFYAEDFDAILAMDVMGGNNTIHVLDADAGTISDTYTVPVTAGNSFWGRTFAYSPGVVWGGADTWIAGGPTEQGIAEYRFNVLSIECPSVPEVQESICVRAGLTEDQVNVLPLAAITREVCCLPWSQISAARVPSETMMGTYFYEATMSGGKVKFVPRGEAVSATIPYNDLGAHMGSAATEDDPLPLRLVNDLETPAFNIVNYINLAQNYQQGSENTDRLISTSAVTLHPLELALGMQPSEAKGVIDTVHRDRASALLHARIKLLRSDYPTLEPTDCVTVTGPDDSQYRVRIVQIMDQFPMLECDVVLDDPNVLSAQGITTTDYESQTTVSLPANSLMRVIDTPILQDSDDTPGVYVLARGDRDRWPGASILDSANNVDFAQKATITTAGVFGTAVTALNDWAGPRMFDFTNTVRVNVDETLSSSTRELVLSNREINVLRFGNGEIVQFVNADVVDDGIYDVSMLLRGCVGTEWAMTGHTAGEAVELLTREGIRRVTLATSDLGVSRYYKAVTLGRAAGTASSRSFAADTGGMKPYAPVRMRVSRDGSDNATLTCERRSRYVCRMVGELGVSIPLSDLDEYRWEIYSDDTYTTLVDVLTSTGPSVGYTAAAQTAAGLTPGDDLHVDVFQMSSVVGKGYPLRRSA